MIAGRPAILRERNTTSGVAGPTDLTTLPPLRQNPFLQKERTFEDYLAYLPPLEIAKTHVTVLTLLGSVYHTK